MTKFLSGKRRVLTLLLALIGIAVTVSYILCLGSCSYLKGDLLGIDLKYLGIFYMTVIGVLAWLRKSFLCLLLLAFGAGGEIILIGYQINTGIYCPYCMVFAVTIFLALAVNFEANRKALTALAAAAGLLFFFLFFSGATTPLYAGEPALPVFGKGTVEVRLYTDYFCEPCMAEEPAVISCMTELYEKNLIRIMFIDFPSSQETVLYADFFLAALNAKRDFRQAAAAREALFAAATKRIKGKDSLEAFLKEKKIDFLPFDTAPVFKIFNTYLREDRILGTPTCVIIDSKGKQTLEGTEEIAKGLRNLQKLEKPQKP